MKRTVVALSCLIGIAISFAAGAVGPGPTATPPRGFLIGVVGTVEVLRTLSNEKAHVDEMTTEGRKARLELDALAKEIEDEEAEQATLKPTSQDYLQQAQTVAEKKAHYNARKDYFDRLLALKQQRWTQKAYTQISQAIRAVTTERGLSLVLVKDDPDPAAPAFIATQKVPHWGDCPDITQEVLDRLRTAQP